MSNNIVFHNQYISKKQKSQRNKQKSCILWFTGLSASGKSTIANELEKILFEDGYSTYLLDGDNIRFGLNKDLGFDNKSRVENIRRIGEVAKLLIDAGLICLSAFISPFEEDRDNIRSLVEKDEFVEIFIDTPLDICENRDPKGLYKKARNGEIAFFTGISSPYENPKNPELHIETKSKSVQESALEIKNYLKENGYLNA